MSKDIAFVQDIVRRYEYDWYLLSLYAPRHARASLWALYAFNHEISKTRDVVSDTTLGLIRLQWWRDEIGKLYEGGGGGQSPILSTLAKAITSYDLPREDFEALVYAHEFDLEDVPPASREGLYNYADFTTTPLVKLSLKMIGEVEEEGRIREESQKNAVLSLMRNVPFMLKNRRCLLPGDSLTAKNLSPQKLYDFNQKEGIIEVIQGVFSPFDSYRKSNSSFLSRLSKLSSIYFIQLKKSGFDVFSPALQKKPPFLALRLLFA